MISTPLLIVLVLGITLPVVVAVALLIRSIINTQKSSGEPSPDLKPYRTKKEETSGSVKSHGSLDQLSIHSSNHPVRVSSASTTGSKAVRFKQAKPQDLSDETMGVENV
jgi:hypothetical protein